MVISSLVPTFAWVDRLDSKTTRERNATRTQQGEDESEREYVEVVEKTWLPPRDSNPDMLIQSRPAPADSTQLQRDSSADCGKVLQNPHHPRPNLGPKRRKNHD